MLFEIIPSFYKSRIWNWLSSKNGSLENMTVTFIIVLV